MLLHVLEMGLLHIKTGVVYFDKMSGQFRSLNRGETNTGIYKNGFKSK